FQRLNGLGVAAERTPPCHFLASPLPYCTDVGTNTAAQVPSGVPRNLCDRRSLSPPHSLIPIPAKAAGMKPGAIGREACGWHQVVLLQGDLTLPPCSHVPQACLPVCAAGDEGVLLRPKRHGLDWVPVPATAGTVSPKLLQGSLSALR